jgi:hypothetical protein
MEKHKHLSNFDYFSLSSNVFFGLLNQVTSPMLYSQCCGMATWRLHCSYRHWWNGALHRGHLLLAIINVIRHCGWYMCWQVPKIHAPSGPNGEQQIKHSSPFCVKGWGCFIWHKGCVTHAMLSFFCIFDTQSTFSIHILQILSCPPYQLGPFMASTMLAMSLCLVLVFLLSLLHPWKQLCFTFGKFFGPTHPL